MCVRYQVLRKVSVRSPAHQYSTHKDDINKLGGTNEGRNTRATFTSSTVSRQARLDHADHAHEGSRRGPGLKRISVASTEWLRREADGAIRVPGCVSLLRSKFSNERVSE